MSKRTFNNTAKLICVFVWAIATHANAQAISTVAGKTTIGYSGDGGPATAAELYFPANVTFDASGNYFIADEGNNVIRKVNSAGVITTVVGNGFAAGTGGGGYSGDGGPATAAEMYGPTDVAFDVSGNMYIVDNMNHVIRKVNTLGMISTIAGTGISGYSGDGSIATIAQFDKPTGIAIDGLGNLFIADQRNQVIRKINSLGIISTIAGNGTMGYSGDGGPSTIASFNYPTSLALDKYNNIYISDQDNSCIRKVSSTGFISTVAGTGSIGHSGDGGAATAALLNYAIGITIDTSGNFYIGDALNHVIRKVNPSGVISTIAGVGTPGYSGDGGPATACKFKSPWGVKVDTHGNLYIADYYNNAIRKITVSEPARVNESGMEKVTLYPNPASTELTIEHASGAEVVVYDVVGREMQRVQISRERQVVDVSRLVQGVYVVEVTSFAEATAVEKGGARVRKIVRVVKE